MAADILLVIPAFREFHRLPPYLLELTAILGPASFQTDILIVDDGSPPDEQQKLLKAVTTGTFGACRVLDPVLQPQNHGKGHAIAHGWSLGRDVKWIGFVDADGAIPAYEVRRLFDLATSIHETPPPCLWASRVRLLGKKINRSLRRYLLGRIFATLASKIIDLPVYDTQCGFKILPYPVYQKIAPLLQETRFCFDVELLLAVHHVGANVWEIPIDWRDVPGGQLHPLRDGFTMLGQLPVIRSRARTWPATASGEASPAA